MKMQCDIPVQEQHTITLFQKVPKAIKELLLVSNEIIMAESLDVVKNPKGKSYLSWHCGLKKRYVCVGASVCVWVKITRTIIVATQPSGKRRTKDCKPCKESIRIYCKILNIKSKAKIHLINHISLSLSN